MAGGGRDGPAARLLRRVPAAVSVLLMLTLCSPGPPGAVVVVSARKVGETCALDRNCDAGLHCETCVADGNVRPRCTRVAPVDPQTKVRTHVTTAIGLIAAAGDTDSCGVSPLLLAVGCVAGAGPAVQPLRVADDAQLVRAARAAVADRGRHSHAVEPAGHRHRAAQREFFPLSILSPPPMQQSTSGVGDPWGRAGGARARRATHANVSFHVVRAVKAYGTVSAGSFGSVESWS
jgi:hypothetical protein